MTNINKILLLIVLSMGSVVMGFAQTHDMPIGNNTDTLIYTTPKQLEQSVNDVATAILKKKYAQKLKDQEYQNKENVRLLKLQMLLSALGMNLGNNSVYNSNNLGNNEAAIMSRLDNIENICYMLLQEKGISIPNRPYVNGRDAKSPIVINPSKNGEQQKEQSQNALTSNLNDTDVNNGNDSIVSALDKRMDNVLSMLEMLENGNQNLESKLKDLKDNVDSVSSNKDNVVDNIVVDTLTIDNTVIDGYKRQIFFTLGGDILTKEAKATLDDVVNIMSKYKSMMLNIIGYASVDGSEKFNLKLSGKRANVVFKYLVNKGISSNRLFVQNGGIDKSNSIKSNARRTDITLCVE